MWGKEEAMKKWIWKHEKKARNQRTEQEDSMENRKNFISKEIQSQDVRRTSNLATRIKNGGDEHPTSVKDGSWGVIDS